MPKYTDEVGLDNYHGIEEFERSQQRMMRKIVRDEIYNNPDIIIMRRAVITALAGSVATIRYTTSEVADTIPNVKVNDGLSVAVNNIVYVATLGRNKRIILFKL